jgi:hypothetical protein
MKKGRRPVSISVVGSGIISDPAKKERPKNKNLTPAAIKIEPLAAARVPVSPVYSIPERDVERLRLAGSTRKDPPLVFKPARFALQQSPLSALCRDLALDMEDAAEILDVPPSQVQYYAEHTREFTPNAWLEIATRLMSPRTSQRISIFEFLDEDDARIVGQAFEKGDDA